MKSCDICNGNISQSYNVREMMFGFREEFEYLLCGDCGCLQIAKIPDDISKYYPENYYSLKITKEKKSRVVRDFIRQSRSRYNISGQGLVGRLLALLKAPDPLHETYRRIGLKTSDRILDVGGGAGSHVRSLQQLGFKDAMAIDLYIDHDVIIDDVLIAKKAEIFDIKENYDVIMLHHSFEHMSNQTDILSKASQLIGKNGHILVRIPTVTSTAWETYKENWVNLDAPRHFYLHSHASIRHLAEQVGLKVLDLWNDSDAGQFWGSEQYKQDIPLTDPRSYSKDKAASIFSPDQIKDFQCRAIELNKNEKGDAICILMGK